MQSIRFKKTYIFISLCIGFFIFLHMLGWTQSIERFFRTLFSAPFMRLYATTSESKSDWNYFTRRDSVTQELAVCKTGLAEAQAEDARDTLLQQENNELRRILQFKKKSNATLVVADVMGKEMSNTAQSLLINRGSRDGLAVGQPVITDEGVLIGKLVAVHEDSAAVRLITDNDSKIAATLLNKDASIGVVEGGYGLSLRMKFIPRNETVVVGDEVVTSGLEPNIPRGLLLGSVAVVENEAYQPFQQAILTPTIDLSKIFLVSVITTQ